MEDLAEPRAASRCRTTSGKPKRDLEDPVPLMIGYELRPPVVTPAPTTPTDVQSVIIDPCGEVDERPSEPSDPSKGARLDGDVRARETEDDVLPRLVREEITEQRVDIEHAAQLRPPHRVSEQSGGSE